ncbi:MAG: glycosyltransferase family 4 protein [Chloroflexi bacterium]|nr:glycosyltransferase family 4 protein [Chloroflexota bacterium]
MLIGIDASRALRAKRTGTEKYSLELINALLDLNTEHEIRLYAPGRPNYDLFRPAAEIVVLPGRRLWTHAKLGPHTRRHPPDVLFVPSHVLPLIGPPRTVVTVHDLGYEYFPDAHPWRERQYLRWSTRRHARVATHILADSHATKDDLINLYAADPERITVIHPALDPNFIPEKDPNRISYVRVSYGIPARGDYLLHVGELRPRKNLARLLEAFALLRKRLPERRLHLVLAGNPTPESRGLFAKASELGLEEHVRFTGFALPHDLAALYGGAACYVFPSLYEGFGFPALEAQLCGVPLACANTSSLPEVAGEGALYFDPLDVEDMAATLERILTDSSLREQLIARGRENVKRFSWKKAAQKTLSVLEAVASS